MARAFGKAYIGRHARFANSRTASGIIDNDNRFKVRSRQANM
jgi:hypothetical protein